MRQSQQAFTLIELMVVMAIMTVIFSLIGPLAQNQVDKVRASEEWYTVTNKSRELASEAFFSGESIELSVRGHLLEVLINDNVIEQVEFSQISFPPQKIKFFPNGYANQKLLTANVRNSKKNLELLPTSVVAFKGIQ